MSIRCINLKRQFALFSIVALLLLSISILTMWVAGRYQRKEFETLSSRASTLQVGQADFSDLDTLRRAYFSHSTTEGTCTPESCTLAIFLTNYLVGRNQPTGSWLNIALLRHLGIRPAAGRVVAILKNGKIQEVHFVTTYQTPTGRWLWAGWSTRSFSAYQQCANRISLQRHPDYLLFEGGSGHAEMPGPFVSTLFRPEATEHEAAMCREIKFACMTSLFDCGRDHNLGAHLFMPQFNDSLMKERELRRNDAERENASQDCPTNGP